VRRNVTVDWAERENVRAHLRRLVKRVLRKHGYPPDKQEKAVYEAVVNLVRAAGEGTERVICHNVKGTACRALTNNMPCPNNTPRPMARHAVP
jgi:anti-sigma regulatory factor (Ser/Thr protein kinase)